jgi:hypothetical protein
MLFPPRVFDLAGAAKKRDAPFLLAMQLEQKTSKLVIPRPGLSAEESAFSQQRHSRFLAQ